MCGPPAMKIQRAKLPIILHAMGPLAHDVKDPQAEKVESVWQRHGTGQRAHMVVQLLICVPRNHENQKAVRK